MTWGASGSRSLNLLLVLPLIVTKLEAPEIALWYLFVSLIQLQLLADFGFSPTFVRVFAYAAGGAEVEDLADQRRPRRRSTDGLTNWHTVELVWGTVRTVYSRLTIGAVVALAAVGTPFVWRPIMAIPEPRMGFAAWAVILVASVVILRGNAYAAYLNGLDHVALVRRWDAIMSLMASATQAAVLVFGGGLFALTIAHQFWMVMGVLRNWYLARTVEGARLAAFNAPRDRRVMQAVWPSAWRSGVGQALGNLPVQLSGLIFAQILAPAQAAQYLLSVNVLNSIRGFAMAPFYSRIPLMARLRVQARLADLRSLAKRRMSWSYWTFVALHLLFGLAGERLLAALGANATLLGHATWGLFGLAYLLERYGAMHLHLYSTTNHILWHIANGATAAVMALCAVLTFGALGVVSFPVSMVVAYALVYTPFIVRRSLQSLDVSAREFDLPTLGGPSLVLGTYTLVAVLGYL